MTKKIISSLLLIFVFGAWQALAQKVGTPAKSSPQRQAILDAVRQPVGKELKQKVSFVVDNLKTQGDWAFLGGQIKNQTGGEPNWKKAGYGQQIDDGVFANNVFALVKKSQGKWRIVTYLISCTDVCYLGWDKEYKAPSALFK